MVVLDVMNRIDEVAWVAFTVAEAAVVEEEHGPAFLNKALCVRLKPKVLLRSL